MSEDKYQPCPCGSGKKLKFCCYEKRASLDDSSDRELLRRAAEFPVYRCLVNSRWEEHGLADVVVMRQLPNLRYLVGVYLVDVFCLGIKDTFVRTRFTHEDIRALLRRLPLPVHELPYEDARSIVMGAVEYARQLGFEPHEDWMTSGSILESERSFDRKFKFGEDGKPFYIQGPRDDAKKIMARLAPLVKAGKAHFLAAADPDAGATSFEERCDEISGLIEQGIFQDARDGIADILEEFPERSDPFFLMGTCLVMEGRDEEAIPFLKRAISLQPSPEAYRNLAAAHKSLYQIDECVICLKKVIELDGKRGEHGKRAKADLDALYSIMQKTSGLTLDRFLENKAQFDRAFGHLTAGRFEEAIRGFTQVLRVEPGHIQSHGNLGLAYAGVGDRDNAIQHFDKAIELDPGYQPALDNRRIVLALPAGERLDSKAIREVEFYAERASAEKANPSAKLPSRAARA